MIANNDRAQLFVRGPAGSQDRLRAEGTVKQMLDRYFREPDTYQREMVLVVGELQYRPAEINGLAERLTAETNESRMHGSQRGQMRGGY